MSHTSSAGDVLSRLREVFGADSDSQLSKVLAIHRQTLGSWRSRNSIPYDICIKVADEQQVSLDWLLTGIGASRRGSNLEQVAPENREEKSLLMLYRRLSPTDRLALQESAKSRERMSEMELRLDKLYARIERGEVEGVRFAPDAAEQRAAADRGELDIKPEKKTKR